MLKSIFVGILLGASALLIADAIAARLDVVPGMALGVSSAGTLSRVLGITAYVALSLDVFFGLLVSTRLADRVVPRPRSVELHAFLSSATLVLVGGHACLLLCQRGAGFDALDALVPFLAPHRRLFTGLGVLAFWGALALHTSFAHRKRLGPSVWRRLHGLSFVVFVLASLHGLFAGSRASWTMWLHLVALTLVGTLTALRLRAART